MYSRIWISGCVAMGAAAIAFLMYPQGRGNPPEGAMPGGPAFRILLGVGDKSATRWDGSVAATPGKIASLRGWRFTGDDSTDGAASWKAATRAALGRKGARLSNVENGVIVVLASDEPDARLDV